MNDNIKNMINSIEDGTFADAERIFNDVMDLKAGQHLDQMRQDLAAGIFNDDTDADEFDHYEITDEDEYGEPQEIEGSDSDEDV